MKKFGWISLAVALGLLVSCTKSGALTGNTSPSTSGNTSVSGSVSGGLSPIANATLSLIDMTKNTVLGTGTTNSTGAYTINFTNPGGNDIIYLQAIGGNAGGGTNSNLTLSVPVGVASNLPTTAQVNELTVAAFAEAVYAFGFATDTNGTVTFRALNNAAGASNFFTQWNNIVSGGKLNTGNSNLTTADQNAIDTIANAIANCVQNPTNCTTLFNTATNATGGAAKNMLDAVVNMLTISTNASSVYSFGFSTAGTTGFTPQNSTPSALSFTMPASTTTLVTGVFSNPRGLAVDASGNIWGVNSSGGSNVIELSSTGAVLGSFSAGSNPFAVAIDSGGNAWVANLSSSNVTEISPSGTTVGTFGVGGSPRDLAIDASGNVWVPNSGGTTVTELSSSGTTLGTFTVGSAPITVAIDAGGNAWVTNNTSHTVSKLSVSGVSLGTFSVASAPGAIAIDANGNVWIPTAGGTFELNSLGSPIGTFVGLSSNQQAAFDAAGNLWANTQGGVIGEMSASGSLVGTFNLNNGSAAWDVIVDSQGNLLAISNSIGGVFRVNSMTTGPQFFPYSGPQFP